MTDLNGYSKEVPNLLALLYIMDDVGLMPWDTKVVIQDNRGNQYPVRVTVENDKVVLIPEVRFE